MVDRTIKVRLEAVTAGFAAALTKAQGNVKSLAGEMGKASQSDGWKQTSTAVLAVGSAAAIAVGVAARSTLDFDKRMSAVKATGLEAQQAFGALRQAAIDAGGATKFSASEAAAGMEALLKAGVSVSDVLGGGLTGSLDLAAAGELDLATAAETAASAMTQFKLSGDQVPRIADALAAGAGKAQGDVSDLAQALGQSGLVASQFGLSLEETVGGLSAFASAGLMGSDSGTSFKTMLLALAKPSKEAAAEMERLGINAYDAQGQFIGLEALAGQLQGALSPLTEETRQSALATIFGTDAIRSASVLYEQGAAGIEKWTTAVSDSGYAAEVAAIMQDNLAGDLEKLGGAFDTLLIKMGEGQNAPLRELAQGVASVVDAASSNPQGVAAMGEGLVGVAGGALALGAAMKVASGVSEFRANIADLATTSPKTAAALTGLAKGAGVATLAIAGLTAVGQLREAFREAPATIDSVTASLVRMSDSGDAVGDAFRTISGKEILGGVDSWEDAFRRVANDTDNWTTAVDNLDGMLSDLTNSRSGIDRIGESFASVDRILTTMDTAEAAEAFASIAADFEAAERPIEELIEAFPEYAGAIQLAAAEQGKGKLSAEELAAAMSTIPDAAIAAAGPTTDLATAADLAAEAADAAAKAHEDWMLTLSSGDSSFVNGQGAWDAVIAKNEAVAQSAADATESTDDSWTDFYDGHTVKLDAYIAELESQVAAQGAWEQNMLLLTGRASEGLLAYLAELGPEGASLVAQLVTGTDAQLQIMEENFGDSGAEGADAWAQEMATRSAVWKELTAKSGAAAVKSAQAELAAGKTTLQSIINNYGLTIKIGVDKTGYWDAMNTLNSIAGKTVSAYVAIRQTGQGAVATGGYGADVAAAVGLADGGMARRRFSEGALLDGPGTPTSDSIPAWLSRREFVTKASSVDYYGPDLMYAMNAKRIPRELFKPLGFADGGSPGHAYYSPRLAGGGMAGAATGAPVLSDNDISRIADAVRFGASAGTREGITERDSMQAHAVGRYR